MTLAFDLTLLVPCSTVLNPDKSGHYQDVLDSDKNPSLPKVSVTTSIALTL